MGSLEDEEAISFQTDYVPSMVIREHNKHIIQPPNFSIHSITKYFRTRIPSLFLTKEERDQFTWSDVFNPFPALKELNGRQWSFFLVGLAGWTWDAFDFFLVSLNVSSIAKDLDKTVKDITWGITLVLMLRSVGAVIFGLWGDRYGRKWPFIANLAMLVVLQIACGFVKSYGAFLGVRALFGIAMGGMFGNCAACALDDAPKKARGFLSGAFQQGYALGYLLVVVFQRAITDNSKYTWRALFWFSAGPAAIFAVWRFFLPETDTFLRQKQKLYENNEKKKLKALEFSAEGKKAVKSYWLVIIYTVLLMSGFNFMSHGSQDLYPTLLSVQYGYSPNRSTVTNSVANLGAITGGLVLGHCSSFVGRRLTIVIGCLLGGSMIYPWAFTKGPGINAGAFFLQAGVQGAWGVIPIHLSELSPPQFRSFVTGVSYQLGNLCSSASSTIESTIGERFPIHRSGEEDIYDYAKVMLIFMGCVFTYVIIITVLGPENRGADLGIERDEIIDDYDINDVTKKSIDSGRVNPDKNITISHIE